MGAGMWFVTGLVGCGAGELRIDDGTPPAPPVPPPPLDLTLVDPAPQSFVGDGPITVTGRTSAATDEVRVEGEPVVVAADGSFSTTVDLDGEVRIVTVDTTRGDETITRRRTVYAGADPRESWPGAMPVRLTPAGLDQLTLVLADQVDAADLPGALAAILPPTTLSGFTFAARSGTADPADVVLTPQGDDLFLGLSLPEFRIAFDAAVPLLPPVPVVLGVSDLRIGGALALDTTPDGDLAVDLVDTDVELRGPILEFAGLDSGLLVFLTGGLLTAVGEAIELALDLGVVPLVELLVPGGTLKTDALGFPLALSLDGVDVDADGVVADLGVGLGVPAVAAPHAPARSEAPPGTDVLVSVHEGLLSALLSSDVLSALDLGTLELPGFLGEIVALPLSELPGGDALPADRTGMCVTVALPSRGVGRVRSGLEPFATLLLPDLAISTAVTTPAERCAPWLSAELAIAADLDARDTVLAVDLAVVDGVVTDYAADAEWTEAEVVAGLGGLVDAISTLLGTSLVIDLSTLVDPALLGGTPAVVSSRPVLDAEGLPIPGVVVLGLRID